MAWFAGLDVPEAALEERLRWLDSLMDPATFRVGYRAASDGGATPVRPGGKAGETGTCPKVS